MTEQRRLAAIVSADVAGYSRLMGRDESGTLAALKALRQEVVDPAIASHGGRIVKTTGDGLLLEFPSVVNAVRCAVEVQTAMADRTAEIAEDRRIAFRIGINIGDIIVEGDDIFGDGVNVAARLQEIAAPGGICVSSRVHEDVRDRLDTAFDDGGTQTLKNIARPVQVWRWQPGTAVAAEASAPADSASATRQALDRRTAVPEHERRSRAGVFRRWPGRGHHHGAVAVQIVVRHRPQFDLHLQGQSRRHQAGRARTRCALRPGRQRPQGRRELRISGQLIDSQTGAHLWADRFDGALVDIFALQDQVAAGVAGVVSSKLDQAEIARAVRKSVGNLDAYDIFLRGMAKMEEANKGALDDALRMFYQAIEFDPAFPTPYAMAARCYGFRKIQGWIVDEEKELAGTRRLAMKVAAIGHDDERALASAGQSLAWVCKDYDVGESLVDQALAINPNSAFCWRMRAYLSLYLGQHQAAIDQISRVFRLNPLDPDIARSEGIMALACVFLGRTRIPSNGPRRPLPDDRTGCCACAFPSLAMRWVATSWKRGGLRRRCTCWIPACA